MGFILKDWYGKEQVFNHDKIFVRDENGELVQFTQGNGDVPAVLQDKTITENGTYTADSGYDGLGSVTVEVAGAGGSSLEPGVYWRNSDLPYISSTYAKYQQSRFALNGKIYAFVLPYKGSGASHITYVWSGTAWTQVVGQTSVSPTPTSLGSLHLYNGKVHIIGDDSTPHWTFDGTTFTKKADLPSKVYSDAVTVLDGKLVAYASGDGNLYAWDENSDSWSLLEQIDANKGYWKIASLNGNLYGCKSYTICKRVDGAWVEIISSGANPDSNMVVMDDCWYFTQGVGGGNYALKKFDPVTETCVILGNIPFRSSSPKLYVFENKIRCLDGPENIYAYENIAEIVE